MYILLTGSEESRTHRQRQVDKIYTLISYVDSGLEGRHPVVVRCDGSWFLSSVSIVESDRPIVPISFYRTDDKRSLPSRIDIGMAVQSVYPRGLFHRGCNGATTTDAFCSLGGHFRQH